MLRERSKFSKKYKTALFAAGAALIVLVLALLNAFYPFQTMLPAYKLPARGEGELRIHFVDVGQGDCQIVEFPEGDVLVIDAGNGSWKNENRLIRYLKGIRPASVSYLATHSDYDHAGGLYALIKYFGAETVYLPAVSSDTESDRKLEEAARSVGAKTEQLARYGVIADESGAYAVCLSPHVVDEGDANDSSCVLYLSFAGIRVLFGGDISSSREDLLVKENKLTEGLFDSGEYEVDLADIDILKVSHHGSASASSLEWISLLSPKVAVISCGRGNAYSHPAAEAVESLYSAQAEIYRTDELGSIIIGISNGSYSVLTHITE